jgi:hypothetical protein
MRHTKNTTFYKLHWQQSDKQQKNGGASASRLSTIQKQKTTWSCYVFNLFSIQFIFIIEIIHLLQLFIKFLP